MAEESIDNNETKINLFEENIFELKCLIKATDISHSARCEIGRKQLLAFTTCHTDIGIYYQPDIYKSPIIKRIKWFKTTDKSISALCFDLTGSWLLVASQDGTIYIVPALALVDKSNTLDHKWSIEDITPITIIDLPSPYSRPTALTWWQGVTQSSHIGIIGTDEGEIIFINIENGQWIGSTQVSGTITSLNICQDNSLEIVSLLITNSQDKQWRLILEQRTNGCLFTINKTSKYNKKNNEKIDDTRPYQTRSRLQGLKQLSVEKLAILKQKLADTRNNKNLTTTTIRRDSESSSSNEEFEILQKKETTIVHPELLSEDVYLSPQYTRQGQHLYTAYCKTTNHITIHGTDVSLVPLHMYKMPEPCCDIILTQRLFFITGPKRKNIWIISCPLAELKIEQKELSKFNNESIIGKFKFNNSKEYINFIYRSSDYPENYNTTTTTTTTNNNDKKNCLPKNIDDLNIEIPPVDTCIIITNFGIYKIVLRKSLLKLFIELALKNNKCDIEKAGRLGIIFGINVQQLFECAGDIHLSNGRFNEAAGLYKISRCRLLKGVLKTAATGHTEKLLGCLCHCLTPPSVSELTTTTRIHLSNLTVFAFSELVLRSSSTLSQDINSIYKDFLIFLSTNHYYDERWVVDVVGQTCLWKVLHHLATQRGLYTQVLDILLTTVNNITLTNTINSKYGLLICISEVNFLQSLLSYPIFAKKHMEFVHKNLSQLQIFVLQRLIDLYDPTNPVFRPLLVRYKSRRRTTSHSSQSSQCDSLDSSDVLDETGSIVEEFIETFLFILLTYLNKKGFTNKHNTNLIGRINYPGIEKRFNIVKNIDFKRRLLSAGYGHVALIRNGNVYTWGTSSNGCLGTGPTISKYGSPQPITIFKQIEVELLSVSCGRCHTLAITNNGIYAWGGSQYGQLGLGRLLQTPNPELIVSLADEIIVDAVAGQYHSVALTMDGRVFTWGWAVHGQLGHGNTIQKNIPTPINYLFGIVIKTIAAGHAHTLCLTVDGILYAFGCNIFGQLGNGNNIKSLIPIKINLINEPITDIATSYFHNLAITMTNKLYTWGSSPQILRLQSQAQKKIKLLEYQAAVDKYNNNDDDDDELTSCCSSSSSNNNNDDLSDIEKLAIKTINERKLNSSNNNIQKIGLKDVNLGLLEENQTHLIPILVDTNLVNGKIVQISTGCHHSALLAKDGTVYTWGRNFDGQIGNGTRCDVTIPTPLTYNPTSVLAQVSQKINNYNFNNTNNNTNNNNNNNSGNGNDNDTINDDINKKLQTNRVIKPVRICCGCEFTVAIQPGGTLLAWGLNNNAQLGRSPTKDTSSISEKLVLIKSSKRVVRLPHGAHVAIDSPTQVPNIPTPVITYQSYDVTPFAGRIRNINIIDKSYTDITLHYILEQFNGIYDSTKIMEKCDELEDYQARSKLALLEQNYLISLAYQLKTLNPDNYKTLVMSSKENYSNDNANNVDKDEDDNIEEINNTDYDDNDDGDDDDDDDDDDNDDNDDCNNKKLKDNTKLFAKHVVKNLVECIEENECKKKIKMTTSKSLDCMQLFEEELYNFDCQGGSEELCEDNKSEDNISLDITEDAFDNDNDNDDKLIKQKFNNNNNKLYIDLMTNDALNIVKFYINEIDENSNKIIQQILETSFTFWINNNLNMNKLENLLLKYINKLYYSLGLLLFCNDIDKNNTSNNNIQIYDAVSTNFSIKVCNLMFRHIEDGKSNHEYIEMLSLLMHQNNGLPITSFTNKNENKTSEQIMKDIINGLSLKSTDPIPFIHIKGDDENIEELLNSNNDRIVFTCGHHYSMTTYESEIVPNMEADLLDAQPHSLPHTAQLLGNILTQNSKKDIICPKCLPKVIQNAVKTVMDS
ncbi:hypothetical protein HCN44_001226 [Aphidius gifuensis]|uniref:RCC1-like domain-containing protein n=1 Tax=Aphidius gifuensis TaxID=684658 RepID=A0A835CNZ5_APHGI|nr:uncharacterized protein LOC122856950 [Aphidius gifuensis]KAF7988653.1 hypothetical protein HCN44_001226 [Aphidius gifuensis]